MSKEAWFREYEKLYEEREDSDEPSETDEQLAQRASDIQVDNQLHRADMAREEEQQK